MIDKRTSMSIVGDMGEPPVQAANAISDAARNPGGMAGQESDWARVSWAVVMAGAMQGATAQQPQQPAADACRHGLPGRRRRGCGRQQDLPGVTIRTRLTKFCMGCGEVRPETGAFCPECGHEPARLEVPQRSAARRSAAEARGRYHCGGALSLPHRGRDHRMRAQTDPPAYSSTPGRAAPPRDHSSGSARTITSVMA